MFKVSPLALGACATALNGNNRTRLAAASINRPANGTVSSQPLNGHLSDELIASRWRREPGKRGWGAIGAFVGAIVHPYHGRPRPKAMRNRYGPAGRRQMRNAHVKWQTGLRRAL